MEDCETPLEPSTKEGPLEKVGTCPRRWLTDYHPSYRLKAAPFFCGLNSSPTCPCSYHLPLLPRNPCSSIPLVAGPSTSDWVLLLKQFCDPDPKASHRLRENIICVLIYGASLVAQTVKNLPECRVTGLISGLERFPRESEWLPTPLLWPGEFHRQRSLVGYSPHGHKESDTTKWLSYTHIYTHTYTYEKFYKLKLKATSNLKTCEIVKLTSKGEYTDGLTYDFSTLWWCKSNMHLVEVRLWILIFSWASNTQHDTLLWCWAAAVCQRSQSAT